MLLLVHLDAHQLTLIASLGRVPKNVKVNFVAGKKAIMTIYEGESSDVWEDGMVEKEKVVLSDYKTKVRRF